MSGRHQQHPEVVMHENVEAAAAVSGWTPIAEEAARATRMLHPQDNLPKPPRRRVKIARPCQGRPALSRSPALVKIVTIARQ